MGPLVPGCHDCNDDNRDDDVDYHVGHDVDVKDAVATLVMILNSHVDNDEAAVIFVAVIPDDGHGAPSVGKEPLGLLAQVDVHHVEGDL